MDSKYNIIISPSVYAAIDKTLTYLIDTYSAKTAAASLLSEWQDSVERIAQFPYAMAKISNQNIANGKDYRKFFVCNFITIYKIDEASRTIQLVAFRYAPSKLGDTI